MNNSKKIFLLCHYSIKKEYLCHKKTLSKLITSKYFNVCISVDINNLSELYFYFKEKKIYNYKFKFNINFSYSLLRKTSNYLINKVHLSNFRFIQFIYNVVFYIEFLRLFFLKKKAAYIFNKFKPDIIFLTIDRTPGIEIGLISEAKKNKIKVVCLQSFLVNISGLLINRKNSINHFNLQNIYKCDFESDHIWNYKNNLYNFFTYPTYKALKKNNILPFNPWVWGSNSDYIFSDSVISSKNLKRYILKNNIINTGNSVTDIIKLCLKNKSLNKKYFSKILISLPHLSEHNYCSVDNHFSELEKLFNEFTKIDEKICLSLHPRSSQKIIDFINKAIPDNCYLLNTKPTFGNTEIIEAISKCYIFVSWYSTSIHYSVLSGKQTLMMNWYDLPNYGIEDIEKYISKINYLEQTSVKINELLYNKNNFKIFDKLNDANSDQLILEELRSIYKLNNE
jgi:hypothetical protein